MTGSNSVILLVLAVTAILGSLGYGQARKNNNVTEVDSNAGSLDGIVSRMEAAQTKNREGYRPYRVTREYKLFDDEQKAQNPQEKPASEVTASLEFTPPDHKTFEIEKVEGSSRGKGVVQHILEGESGKSGKGPAALTRENYEFSLLGQDSIGGRPCWVLGVKPHHEDKNTIKGKAWVDKDTYLVQQVQGEMAKSPSWWLKKVEMTVRFGDAAGMWLPTGTYAVADVRFFGRHVLTSQAVEIQTSEEAAKVFPSVSPARVHRFRTVPAMVGTAIYQH